ncbi:hypothetical protein TcCL_Unassigned03909, partial [Trypanosoma cruzi]
GRATVFCGGQRKWTREHHARQGNTNTLLPATTFANTSSKQRSLIPLVASHTHTVSPSPWVWTPASLAATLLLHGPPPHTLTLLLLPQAREQNNPNGHYEHHRKRHSDAHLTLGLSPCVHAWRLHGTHTARCVAKASMRHCRRPCAECTQSPHCSLPA